MDAIANLVKDGRSLTKFSKRVENMANNIVRFDGAADSGSPFDSIRQVDGDGKEFWSARDLMGLTGYPRWNEFVKAIDRAEVSCKTLEGSSTAHFRVKADMVGRVQGGGRRQIDYHLSRFGCYLVAMNGDPRKPEIAAAQTYFAIKTREAEVVIPAQNEALALASIENENLKLQNENLRLQLQVTTAQQGLESFRHAIVATCPEPTVQKILGCKEIQTIEYRDRIIKEDEVINDGGTATKSQLCYRYGILTRNGKPDYKRLNDALVRLPNEAFKVSVRIQENQELLREFLPQLDALIDGTDRNLWIGE
jgi:hypothetical protein